MLVENSTLPNGGPKINAPTYSTDAACTTKHNYPEVGSIPNFLKASSRVPRSTLGLVSRPKGMCRFTKPLARSLPFRLVETNLFVSFGFRGRLGFSGSVGGGITSSCISSLMICGSRRVSVGPGDTGDGDLDVARRGGSPRSTLTLITGSSSSSMIIVGSLGVVLPGGGVGVTEGRF